MSSKTSAAVKNRYRDKNFDRIEFIVPKGKKDLIKQHAESKGYSLNGYINKLIQDDIKEK